MIEAISLLSCSFVRGLLETTFGYVHRRPIIIIVATCCARGMVVAYVIRGCGMYAYIYVLGSVSL